MRFEIALATFLVAESSSLVTAKGDIKESAKLRREAIEAISKHNNNGDESRRLLQQQQGRKNNGRIWKAPNNRFQELSRKLQASGTTTRRLLENNNNYDRAPDTPRNSDSDSELPDLGILPAGPANDEQQQQHKLSTKDSILNETIEKRTILKNRLDKTLMNAKRQREKGFTSKDSGNGHPDLGIISSARTTAKQQQQLQKNTATTWSHSIKSSVQKFRRRMQTIGGGEIDDSILDDIFDEVDPFRPILSLGNTYCAISSAYEEAYGTPICTTCEIIEFNSNNEDGALIGSYDLDLDCPNTPEDAGFGDALLDFCEMEVCDTCIVDTENYVVDMQDCNMNDYFGGMLDDAFGDLDDAFNRPIALLGKSYCEEVQLLAEEKCTTCELTYSYDEDGSQIAPYSLEMDCPEADTKDEDNEEALTALKEFCAINVCETCSVDIEKFQVDMQNCDFSEVGNVLDDTFGSFGDAFTKPVAFTGNTYCELNKLMAAEPCTTCELTYTYDEDGSKTAPYSLEMDCPDALENETLESLNEFCSLNICEKCNLNYENFQVDMQNCDFANSPYGLDLDDISDNLVNEIGGYIGMPNKTIEEYQIESVALLFDYYFGSLCEEGGLTTDTNSCAACGQKSSNGTTFSFEINCPSKLSASENGFGSYMLLAQAFCSCPALSYVQCSTCEVNSWDSTINIQDCVPIGAFPGETDSCVTNQVYNEYKVEFDHASMAYSYSAFCDQPEIYFLQDTIGRPDCDCTFDEATQTASFSCTYEPKCQNITSYCPEGVQFCYSDRIDMTFERYGASTLRRCVDISSPNNFSYCASFSITADDDSSNATDTNLSTCEMEVDGMICNSCKIVENEYRYYTLGFVNYVDAIYDCSNTVIGMNGSGNLTAYKILDDTLSYFIYKSLPCQGGCDLCGVEGDGNGQKSEFMTVRDGMFSSELWKNGTEDTCFDAQLDAMINRQLLTTEECQAVRDSAREPCGCKNPDIILSPVSDASKDDSETSDSEESSGAYSFGNKLASSGAMLLTLTATSIVSILLG